MADTKTIIDFFSKEAPQIGITHEFLTNLQTDPLIQAYQFLCDLIFEDISNPEQADPHNDKFSNEQLVARPSLIIKLGKSVNHIFHSIYNGSDEFCYTDLILPDPRRTRNFLAHMIRFYYFKCEMSKDLIRLDNEIEERRRIRAFEKAQEKGKKEKIKREMEQLTELESKKANLKKAEEGRSHALDAAKLEANSKKSDLEKTKRRLDEMETKMNDNKQKVLELENTGKRLDMNIVSSPDRIVAELEQLKKEREAAERKLEQTVQNAHKLERDMNENQLIDNCISALSDKLGKILTMQHRVLELRAMDDKNMQEINELEQRKKNSQQAIEEERKAAVIELENLQKEVQNSEREFDAIKHQMAKLTKDEKEMADRLQKTMENIREHQQMIKHKDRMNIVVTEKYDAAVQKMLTDCDNLGDKVNEEQNALSKVEEDIVSMYCS